MSGMLIVDSRELRASKVRSASFFALCEPLTSDLPARHSSLLHALSAFLVSQMSIMPLCGKSIFRGHYRCTSGSHPNLLAIDVISRQGQQLDANQVKQLITWLK
jgi:hypothetical protein